MKDFGKKKNKNRDFFLNFKGQNRDFFRFSRGKNRDFFLPLHIPIPIKQFL